MSRASTHLVGATIYSRERSCQQPKPGLVMARRLVSWYDRHLRTAPIRTKALTSFTILTGADVIRQRFFEAPRIAPPVHRDGIVNGTVNGSTGAAVHIPRACEDHPVHAESAGWWDSERTARMELFSCSLHPIWVHQ